MATEPSARTPEDFFRGFPQGLELYAAVARAVHDLDDVSIRVTKSQIAFRRRRGFAYVWRPGQYVRSDVPAVLTIALPRPLVSDRIKSVVHPASGVWIHHLELLDPRDVDEEVRTWLAEAYASAAAP